MKKQREKWNENPVWVNENKTMKKAKAKLWMEESAKKKFSLHADEEKFKINRIEGSTNDITGLTRTRTKTMNVWTRQWQKWYAMWMKKDVFIQWNAFSSSNLN